MEGAIEARMGWLEIIKHFSRKSVNACILENLRSNLCTLVLKIKIIDVEKRYDSTHADLVGTESKARETMCGSTLHSMDRDNQVVIES